MPPRLRGRSHGVDTTLKPVLRRPEERRTEGITQHQRNGSLPRPSFGSRPVCFGRPTVRRNRSGRSRLRARTSCTAHRKSRTGGRPPTNGKTTFHRAERRAPSGGIVRTVKSRGPGSQVRSTPEELSNRIGRGCQGAKSTFSPLSSVLTIRRTIVRRRYRPDERRGDGGSSYWVSVAGSTLTPGPMVEESATRWM